MPCFSQKHGETITTPSPVFKIEQRNPDFILRESFTMSILLLGTPSYVHRAFDGIIPSVEKL